MAEVVEQQATCFVSADTAAAGVDDDAQGVDVDDRREGAQTISRVAEAAVGGDALAKASG